MTRLPLRVAAVFPLTFTVALVTVAPLGWRRRMRKLRRDTQRFADGSTATEENATATGFAGGTGAGAAAAGAAGAAGGALGVPGGSGGGSSRPKTVMAPSPCPVA